MRSTSSYVDPKSSSGWGLTISESKFKAIQDYTFRGIDVTFDYSLELTAGLRLSAIIKGLEGFDINMGSVKLATYSWNKNKWDHVTGKDVDYSLGFSVDHEGLGMGGELSFHSLDGNIESLKLQGNIDYDILTFKASYDVVKKQFGAELGLEGSLGLGLVATAQLKLVIEQHKAFH